MKTLDDILKNKVNGLHYGNRILLPFVCDLFKAVVENDIVMDFSPTHKSAEYFKHEDYTEIYFYDFENLSEVITKYETIKLVVVENGKDIFDDSNHRKLVLHFLEKHKLKIEETNEDILLIE